MKRTLLVFGAGLLVGIVLTVAAWLVPGALLLRGFDRESARRVRTAADLNAYAQSCHCYRQVLGAWPESLDALRGQNPRGMKFILVPEPQFARDAWGQPLAFEPFDPRRGDLSLRSPGADLELHFNEHGTLRPWLSP